MSLRPRFGGLGRAGIPMLVAVLVLTTAGCSFREAAVEPAAEPEASALPPNDRDEIAAMFEDDLRPFGLRLTRAALIDLSDNSYEASDTGTHLALYVEPISDDYSRLDYLRNLVPVTKVFAPQVFERWSGLLSFDVCQEPPGAIDADEEPPPETQVNLSREQSEAIDWDTIDDVDLIAAALREPPGARLIISERIRDLPAYEDLLAAVEKETGLTPTDRSED